MSDIESVPVYGYDLINSVWRATNGDSKAVLRIKRVHRIGGDYLIIWAVLVEGEVAEDLGTYKGVPLLPKLPIRLRMERMGLGVWTEEFGEDSLKPTVVFQGGAYEYHGDGDR